MSCQVCHSWICKCADTLPDAIKLRDHIARIAALEKQNAELLAALKEVVAFWDAITMEDAVNEIHVKARAALAALQPSTQEVSK